MGTISFARRPSCTAKKSWEFRVELTATSKRNKYDDASAVETKTKYLFQPHPQRLREELVLARSPWLLLGRSWLD